MSISRVLPLLALLAAPAIAGNSWPISKPDAKYPHHVQSNNARFAFLEPADAIHPPEGNDCNFQAINGVMVQTFYVPAVRGTPEVSLAAYRKAETALLQQSGAVVAESRFCDAQKLPHAEWRATLKGIRDSRYLAVKAGDAIRMVIVGSNAGSPKGGAEKKMTELCASLRG